MAYQALARKWRPRKFSEVVGQEHVVKALTHALEFDRMHHAYLFTGTRGVGKTTLARILAKALNCEARRGYDPCCNCLVCQAVDEGRFVDLIEVDAASRTKVEDTRDLLENVQYAPSEGRYKIYLIDEVHMLSGHSFNALLKTLEEPPPHVKFLLATTDPQKIPVTVLSRCLQFNLKRLTPEQIRMQMETILRQEHIDFDPNAVRSLARVADGSMRDGLSLLDQAIVHGGGRLDETQVSAMLGIVARKPVFDLLDALSTGDAGALLAHVDELAEHAPSYVDVLQQLLIVLHHIALAQWAPETAKHDDDAERIIALAGQLSPEDVQLFYQIGLIGQRDLPLAPEPRVGLEMVLLRMLAFRPIGDETAEWPASDRKPRHAVQAKAPSRPTVSPITRLQTVKETLDAAAATAAHSKSAVLEPECSPTTTLAEPVGLVGRLSDSASAESGVVVDAFRLSALPTDSKEQSGVHGTSRSLPAAERENQGHAHDSAGTPSTPPLDWPKLIRAMRLAGPTQQLASHCVLVAVEENRVVLALDPASAQIRTDRTEARLEKALQTHLGRALKLVIHIETPPLETPALRLQREKAERQRAAELEIERDPNVLALKERFDARIVPGSIKPLD